MDFKGTMNSRVFHHVQCWQMHLVLSMSSGEKVNDTVNIGGVADMAGIQVKIKYIFNTVDFHREGLAIGKMVDDLVNGTEINGPGK